jgi:hypothetical protein
MNVVFIVIFFKLFFLIIFYLKKYLIDFLYYFDIDILVLKIKINSKKYYFDMFLIRKYF